MHCVTGVYLRDITYMIFVILHLNTSHLSNCSSCSMKAPFSHFTCVQVESKETTHAKRKADDQFLERLEQVQLAEE